MSQLRAEFGTVAPKELMLWTSYFSQRTNHTIPLSWLLPRNAPLFTTLCDAGCGDFALSLKKLNRSLASDFPIKSVLGGRGRDALSKAARMQACSQSERRSYASSYRNPQILLVLFFVRKVQSCGAMLQAITTLNSFRSFFKRKGHSCAALLFKNAVAFRNTLPKCSQGASSPPTRKTERTPRAPDRRTSKPHRPPPYTSR